MKSYYLYRHLDTINNIPFYIGVGTNSENKYYKRSRDKIRRSDEWKEYVKNVCPNYKIEILLECNDYAYISKKEIEFIALYGRQLWIKE